MSVENGIKWKYLVATIITIFIATPIFIQSFGCSLLNKPTHGQNGGFEAESKMIYLGASVLGQISYSLFSGLNGGFLIFPAFENRSVSHRIHRRCTEHDADGFVNTLACLSTAAVITALTAFILSVHKIGNCLNMIPINIIVVIMVKSGIELFLFGCSHYITENIAFSAVFIAISILLTLGLLLLLKKNRNPFMTIIYVIGIIVLMNLARLLFPSDFWYQHRLFMAPIKEKMSIGGFIRKIRFASLSFPTIAKNWQEILSMAVFPLIPFAVNLPTYSAGLEIPFCPERELLAFGMSNLLSSLSFYPTYFNCSGSMLFHLCGSNTRFYSFVAGLTMICLYFILHTVTRNLPTFAISLLTQFIGLSFFLSYVPILCRASTPDIVAAVVMFAGGILLGGNTIVLLVLGLLINLAMALFYTRTFRLFKTDISVKRSDDRTVITIDGMLGCHNVQSVTSVLFSEPSLVVLDLRGCTYIDMTANLDLRKAIAYRQANGYLLAATGSPPNLYKHLYGAVDLDTTKGLLPGEDA